MLEWFRSLTYLSSLGSGGFAHVYKAVDQDGDYFAVKVVSKHKQEQNIIREVSAGLSLQHKNLVSFLSHFEDAQQHYLVFEHIRGKNLFEFMEARNMERLSEEEAVVIINQLLDAVEYCHSKNVVHFDIKLDNIMYNALTHVAQLIDFGLCDFITLDNKGVFSKRVGSEEYIAPEVFLKDVPFVGTKVDIWCLGVVFYALLTATFPFPVEERLRCVRYGKPHPSLKVPPYLSDDCRDLLAKMLEQDPNKRLNMKQIRHHCWFSKVLNKRD